MYSRQFSLVAIHILLKLFPVKYLKTMSETHVWIGLRVIKKSLKTIYQCIYFRLIDMLSDKCIDSLIVIERTHGKVIWSQNHAPVQVCMLPLY